MEKLILRHKNFQNALRMLNKALENFNIVVSHADILTKEQLAIPLHFSDLFLATRESMIQRFEYCVDLFWKYLKDYLELELKIILKPSGPKNIIREAARLKILSEDESQLALKMIDSRNMTSHIYREEIAEQITLEIPGFYSLMKKIIDPLQPNE